MGDPLLVSTDPLSFLLQHEDTEYGRTCGLDPWAPKSGPLRNFTPSQPKSSSKLLPHVHCRISSRLLMALVTRSALSRQTLWLSLFWARLDSQAPGLTCSGRRNCTVLSPAGQHTDTRIWGPGGLHRPHQPVLSPSVCSSQPPSPEILPLEETPQKEVPGLAWSVLPVR